MVNNITKKHTEVTMSEMEERIKEIKRLRNNKAQREWAKRNPTTVKKWRDEWNKKKRNEYQKDYREKNETTNQTPNSDNKINRSAIPSRPKGSIAKKNIGI